MKYAYCSDLHLELEKGTTYNIDLPKADVLLLAGDTTTYDALLHSPVIHKFFHDAYKIYSKIVFVLGNREYYDIPINNAHKLYESFFKENYGGRILVLNNKMANVGDAYVAGTTLWSDFNSFDEKLLDDCVKYDEDYKHISFNKMIGVDEVNLKLSVKEMKFLNKQGRKVYTSLLNRTYSEKNVLVSYYAPTIRSIPVRHRKNYAMFSKVNTKIEPMLRDDIIVWVHGNMHDPVEYRHSSLYVFCNPRGYPTDPYYKEFKIKTFDL